MQLEYIWVHKFRNIEKQGFNFSPSKKYRFNIDEQNLEIISDIKTKRGFFNLHDEFNLDVSQIINATGVVGKNGTGKSNLLEVVCMLLSGSENHELEAFALVLTPDRSDYIVHSNIKTPITKQGLLLNEYKKPLEVFRPVFFTNAIDGPQRNFNTHVVKIFDRSDERGFSKSSRFTDEIAFLNSDYYKEFNLVGHPDSYLIETNLLSKKYNKVKDDSSSVFQMFYGEIRERLSRNVKSKNLFKYALSFSIFFDEVFRLEQFQITLEKLFPSINFNELVNHDIDEIHSTILNELKEFGFQDALKFGERLTKKDELRLTGIRDSFQSLEGFADINEIQNTITGRSDYRTITFKLEASKKNHKFMKSLLQGMKNIGSSITCTWSGMSSGQRAMLNFFSKFYAKLNRKTKPITNVICIDEGDLYLHPQWQTEFFYYVVKYLPAILKSSQKVQIIITSHSPFIVSDLPKENLILLNQGKVDSDNMMKFNMVSKDGSELVHETFGAPVSDLYLDSFFLDTTFSKFSMKKLQELSKTIDVLVLIYRRDLAQFNLDKSEDQKNEFSLMLNDSNHYTVIKNLKLIVTEYGIVSDEFHEEFLLVLDQISMVGDRGIRSSFLYDIKGLFL